ncbi:hypothetical protein Dimus_029232 [Dionaea muscipula]
MLGCWTFSYMPFVAYVLLTNLLLITRRLIVQGHEGKFSIYIHASQKRAVRKSQYFKGRDIQSDKVEWGQVSMVDAEKCLLANALQDPDNHHFVILSDRCIA